MPKPIKVSFTVEMVVNGDESLFAVMAKVRTASVILRRFGFDLLGRAKIGW